MSGNTNVSNGSISQRESFRESLSVPQQSSTENDLHRISFNHSAVLGAFYDTRAESIVDQLQLDKKIKSKPSQLKQIQCELMRAVEIDRKDIFQKVRFDEESWLNSVLGFFPSEDMAALVNYSFPKSSNVRFLYYYYSSEEQSISDTQNIVRDYISKDVPTISATHIISSVKLGIQALIVLELSNDNEINLNGLLENTTKQLSRNQFPTSGKDIPSFDGIFVRKVFSNIAAISKMTRLVEICQKITEIKQHAFEQRSLEFTLRSIKWYYPNYHKGKARCTLLRPEMIKMINVYLQTFSTEIEKFNTSFNAQEIDTLKRHLNTAYDTFQQQITDANKIYSNELKRVRELIIKIRNGIIQQEQIIEESSQEFTKSLRDNFDPIDKSLQHLKKKLKLISKLGEREIRYIHMQRYSIRENDDLKEFFRKQRTTKKSQLIYCSHDDDAKGPNSAECKDQFDKWMEKGKNDLELILIFADFTDTQYPLPQERILFIESTNDEQKQLKPPDLSSGRMEELPSSISETTPTKEQDSANMSEQQKPSKSRRSSMPPMLAEPNNQPETAKGLPRSMPSPMESNEQTVSAAAAKEVSSPQRTAAKKRRRSRNSDGAHQSPRSEDTLASGEPHNASQPVMISSSSDSSQTKHSNSDVATSLTPLSEQSQSSSTCNKENSSSPLRASHNLQPVSKQSEDAVQHANPSDSAESFSSTTTQAPAIESGETATLSVVPKLNDGANGRKAFHNDQHYIRPSSAPSSISNVPRPPYESNEIKKNSSKSPRLSEPTRTKSGLLSKDDNVSAKHHTDSLLPSRPSSASLDPRNRRRMDLSAKRANNTLNSSGILSPRPVHRKVRTAFEDEASDSSTINMRSLSETLDTDRIDKHNQSTPEKLSRTKSATVSKGEFEDKKVHNKSIVSSTSPDPAGNKHSATAKAEPNHEKPQDIPTVEESNHAESSKTSAENLNDKKDRR